MSETEQDNVHRIFNELVQFGLISSNIKLKKNDQNNSRNDTINYIDYVNKSNDDAIVLFIGHEFGHYILPQTPLRQILFLIIFTLSLFFSEGNIVLGLINFIPVKVLGSIIFFLVIYLLSNELHNDEYRSDIVGAMILNEYGRIKSKKVIPSKSLSDYFSSSANQNNSNNSILHKIDSFLKLKLDFFFHPPNKKRTKKLEEFEKLNM